MASYDVAVDPAVYPGLAGPTCHSAHVVTYDQPENLVEVAWQQAHYARIFCFDGPIKANKVSGSLLMVGSDGYQQLGTRDTFGQLSQAGTLDDLLASYFQ